MVGENVGRVGRPSVLIACRKGAQQPNAGLQRGGDQSGYVLIAGSLVTRLNSARNQGLVRHIRRRMARLRGVGVESFDRHRAQHYIVCSFLCWLSDRLMD